jgi:crotonobetaine/carnitine-CoA ligase
MTNWDWVGPKLPPREESVLRHTLEARARDHPDRTYVRFEDGTIWTYADTLDHARRAAAGLAKLGVSAGQAVFVLLPNGPDFLKIWFGVNFLGAILAAANVALRGALLEHLVQLSAARLAVVDQSLLDRFDDIDFGSVETILVSGTIGERAPGRIDLLPIAAVIDEPDAASVPEILVEPWHTQFILFTSGTTGPSKGAIVPYVQMHDLVMTSFGARLGETDNYLVNMPLFHISGTRAAIGMMMLGGSFSLVTHFRTETFWDTVRQTGTTACVLLGAAATFLESQPERPDDADNPMRLVAMLPMVNDAKAWSRRFNVDLTTSYGMSELSMPIISDVNPTNTESCGKLRPGYQARIVDEFDQELREGEAGELILRADRPWTISPGYWRMPEATAAAWRNGWFHTGDRFRRNAKGEYYFVDRQKDVIRRRGENISSFEVEAELLRHPDIREAAAIAVPSPYGEDDVMVVIALLPGSTLNAEDLFEHLRPRMAHFMLPRYIRFMAALPKTPSLRVQKHALRADGVTDDCWDREAAGIRVTRNA